MEIKTGYIYHIKDEFFDVVKDESLMANHENGGKRPTYFTIKDNNILWFIPLRSKVLKYQRIIKNKEKKYGSCISIMIREVLDEPHAILLQNAFPTLEKYRDHVHIKSGVPVKVSNTLKDNILKNFKRMMTLKNKGINLFFTDIDKIKSIMEKEIYQTN